MRLPIIKHLVEFIEQNDADYIEETISVLEHLTENSNIKDQGDIYWQSVGIPVTGSGGGGVDGRFFSGGNRTGIPVRRTTGMAVPVTVPGIPVAMFSPEESPSGT